MKKVVISILVLLLLFMIYLLIQKERFQNIEGNFKISELIDFEELKGVFTVETEDIPKKPKQELYLPLQQNSNNNNSADTEGSSLLAELMEFMAAITREEFTNYNVVEKFESEKIEKLSINRDFLNRVLNDGNIRSSYKELIYDYEINNDEINEALANDKEVADTMISLKNILCKTIVSLKFNKTLKKLAVDLLMFNVDNGEEVKQLVYDDSTEARFNIKNNPIDGDDNTSSFEKMVESCVLIYNNSLISRVVNEYLKTDSQKEKFFNDIKNSVNHVLCNLKSTDNIPAPNDDTNLICNGFGNNLNIKVDFDSNYFFSVEKTSPLCSFTCPQLENNSNNSNNNNNNNSGVTNQLKNYNINFTVVSSQNNNYYISLSEMNDNINIDDTTITINTSGIFKFNFFGFGNKIHLSKPFTINITHDDVTIDGDNNLIYIDSNELNNGLIRHHDGSKVEKNNSINRCIIKNFDVNINIMNYENNSSKSKGYGVLCSSNFGARGANNVIKDCTVHCNNMGDGGGGIVGSHAGFEGSLVISGCTYIGNLNMMYSDGYTSCGGITGNNLGEKGRVLIYNCKTLGHIYCNYSGGICAENVGANGGIVVISNCTMAGNIKGDSAMERGSGGICGGYCGIDMINYESNSLKSRVFIVNCNVLGNMASYIQESGGILGAGVALGGDVFLIGCRTHFSESLSTDSGYFIGSISSESEAKNSNVYVIYCSNKTFTSSFPLDLLVGRGELKSSNVIGLSGNLPSVQNYEVTTNQLSNPLGLRKQFPLSTLSMNHSTKVFSIDNNNIFNDASTPEIVISLYENWNHSMVNPNCNSYDGGNTYYRDLNMLKNSKLNNICPIDDMQDYNYNKDELHRKYESEYSNNTNFNSCKYKSLEFCNNETNCNYELYSRSDSSEYYIGSDYMCIPKGSSGSSNFNPGDPDSPGYQQYVCSFYSTKDNCNDNPDCSWNQREYPDQSTCDASA